MSVCQWHMSSANMLTSFIRYFLTEHNYCQTHDISLRPNDIDLVQNIILPLKSEACAGFTGSWAL